MPRSQELKKNKEKNKEKVDNWTKAGVLIGAAALLFAYLGVAGTVKWWPFEQASKGSVPSTLAASTPTVPTSASTLSTPTASPPTTLSSPTMSASPTIPVTESDQTLINHLDAKYFNTSDCQDRSDQQSNVDALAAINCPAYEENGNVPVGNPLVVQFANGSALMQWFNANTSGFPQSNGCDRNGYIGMWHTSSGTQGQLGCAEIKNGTDFRMVWTLTSANIGVIADGSSDNALWSWWTSASSVTGCTCSH